MAIGEDNPASMELEARIRVLAVAGVANERMASGSQLRANLPLFACKQMNVQQGLVFSFL